MKKDTDIMKSWITTPIFPSVVRVGIDGVIVTRGGIWD